ncbi:MAG: four helix bundle protein [Clostridia bacterium]|nr:four helix bundle protein [Clostridia bacterium]
MKSDNIVFDKSKAFAIRIVNLYKYLTDGKKEFILSKQLLRSGTSIGANIAEAICSVSRNEFSAKMHIAYKECSETLYWLELLKETEYINQNEYDSIASDCKELVRILSAITKTAKIN